MSKRFSVRETVRVKVRVSVRVRVLDPQRPVLPGKIAASVGYGLQ